MNNNKLLCYLLILAGGTLVACNNGTGGSSNNSSSATIQSISLKQANYSTNSQAGVMPVGFSFGYQAIATYSDGSQKDVTNLVTLNSESSGIIQIESAGQVVNGVSLGQAVPYAYSAGTTAITASYQGITSNSLSLKAISDSLTSVTINAATAIIPNSYQEAITAVGTFADNQIFDISHDVAWLSNQTNILKFGSNYATNNIVSSAGVGNATISASYASASSAIQRALNTTTITSNDLAFDVTDATLKTIVLNQTGSSLPKGTSASYLAYGVFSDGTVLNITQQATWATASNSVATVIYNTTTQNAVVNAIDTGSTTISASANNVTASAGINVTDATLQALNVSINNTSIAKGLTTQATATGTYSDKSTHDLTTNASWSANNSNVTVVNGKVTGVNTGSTEISATYAGISNKATVNVTDAVLESVAISAPSNTIVKGLNETLTLVASYSDGSNASLTNGVSWTSSDSAIISVKNGVVTANAAGSATITASYNGKTATYTLTATAAQVTDIQLVVDNTNIPMGETSKLDAVVTFNNGESKTYNYLPANVTLLCNGTSCASNQNIIINTSDGTITGLTKGNIAIQINYNKLVSNIIQINVTDAEVIGLAIDAPTKLGYGVTESLHVYKLLSDGSKLDYTQNANITSSQNSVISINKDSSTITSNAPTGNSTLMAKLSINGNDYESSLIVNSIVSAYYINNLSGMDNHSIYACGVSHINGTFGKCYIANSPTNLSDMHPSYALAIKNNILYSYVSSSNMIVKYTINPDGSLKYYSSISTNTYDLTTSMTINNNTLFIAGYSQKRIIVESCPIINDTINCIDITSNFTNLNSIYGFYTISANNNYIYFNGPSTSFGAFESPSITLQPINQPLSLYAKLVFYKFDK
ncbi:MAG: hypothetical protein RLZZ293_313, partial [Pseudomonadota bacterium]